jgi:urease accessory protein
VRILRATVNEARVALVAEGALLVAGDDVEIGMHVGAGVRLTVVEPAGTVVYAMRGGSARWTVGLEVEDGGVLVWRAEPFVVASGANVIRRVDVALRGAGVAVLREVLVLGRAGEAGGCLDQQVRVARDGTALLAEDLAVDGAQPRVGVLGTSRVVDSVSVLGTRAPGIPTPAGAHRLELEREGTVVRWLGAAVHLSPLEAVWCAASEGYSELG